MEIIKENLQWNDIKLDDLRKLASQHQAFKKVTRLEDMVLNLNKKHGMNIKLIFLPKFHVELNPIEM